MRKTFAHRREVCHIWAQQTHPEGRAGNVFFEGEKLYSYGKHFCIARILPSGVVVFGTHTYSASTGQHQSFARQAVSHRTVVYCYDPDRGAHFNMQHARDMVVKLLQMADTPRRVLPKTRLASKAAALRTAEEANAYLAALPDDEKVGVLPIDLTNLEAIREEVEKAEEAARLAQEERERREQAALLPKLEEWRQGKPLLANLYALPPALRLHEGEVETSHGASIPVEDALRLWPLILRTKEGNRTYEVGMELGNFRLTKINRDGSIVVGCHNIAFSEIEGIARALKLL